MCGIFAYLSRNTISPSNLVTVRKYAQKIKHRGPDNTQIKFVRPNLLFIFHRLVVNGLERDSDQPLRLGKCVLICNGEIYNYKTLVTKYGFQYQSHSDCEIILHMFQRFGIERTVKELDGVFAFVLYDEEKEKIYAARDPIGIRSMFYGTDQSGDICFASEAKSLRFIDKFQQFPPGKWLEFDIRDVLAVLELDTMFHTYYQYEYKVKEQDEDTICKKLKELLTKAVDKRMMSDRKVCCLLSGGLDSTLVTALVNKHYGMKELDTYSIGMEGSVDLYYARKAAEYLGTNHREVVVTEEEFLAAIAKTIYQIESFCTTSVRASVGNYLVSLYIKENGDDDTVVFCGDLSDEIFASYRGFMKADNAENFFHANVKLLEDVHYYDVLRSDKSISGASLEARVPFADKELVNYVMSIDPRLKMFDDKKIEKYLLRKAFQEDKILSEELLWRRKEAFSDGVSGHERSWFQIIREYVDKKIPDGEFEGRCAKFEHCRPYDKESLFYREIFEVFFPGHGNMIPYYWRHPFNTSLDPSARLLDCYKHDT